jgi:hypothetical protein
MTNTPKVVGGFTPAGTKVAADFYSMFVDSVVAAKGTREAEMAKLLENTYRHVNIALMNELVEFCHLLEIDLWDAIRCASTKPFSALATVWLFANTVLTNCFLPLDTVSMNVSVINMLFLLNRRILLLRPALCSTVQSI